MLLLLFQKCALFLAISLIVYVLVEMCVEINDIRQNSKNRPRF